MSGSSNEAQPVRFHGPEIVPGYVCNPGSQRERDAASKR